MLKGIFKIHKLSCGGNLCTVNTDFKPDWKLWYLEGFKMFHISETEPSRCCVVQFLKGLTSRIFSI